MCEATFRSSTPRSYLNITYPVYAEVNSSIELKANGKGKQELIGTTRGAVGSLRNTARNSQEPLQGV